MSRRESSLAFRSLPVTALPGVATEIRRTASLTWLSLHVPTGRLRRMQDNELQAQPTAQPTRARANAAFAAGNYLDAVTQFTALLAYEPESAALLCNRSAALLRMGRRDEAAVDAEHAAAASVSDVPQHVKALYRLANALHDGDKSHGDALQRSARALEVLRGALSLAPENVQLATLASSVEATLQARLGRTVSTTAGTASPERRSAVKLTSRRLPPPPGHQPSEVPPPYDPPEAPAPTPFELLGLLSDSTTSTPAPAARPTGPRGWQWAFGLCGRSTWRWGVATWHMCTRVTSTWLINSHKWLWQLILPPPSTPPPPCPPLSEPLVAAAAPISASTTASAAAYSSAASASAASASAAASASSIEEGVGLCTLPSELLLEVLGSLALLELLQSKCVSRAFADEVRRLLAWRGVRLPAGTFVFTASWDQPHPAAMWPEADLITLHATGTLSLSTWPHTSPNASAHGTVSGDGWTGGASGQCTVGDGRAIVSTCNGCWREGSHSGAHPQPSAETAGEAWGEGPRGVWSRASADGARLRLWWLHEPPSSVLVRDPRRLGAELVVLDLTVERPIVSSMKQTWMLCGTWLGLPPGSAAVAASDASASLATGQVRVEMGYLYGPREAGPDPMGPRAQPSSGAKADGLRGVLV